MSLHQIKLPNPKANRKQEQKQIRLQCVLISYVINIASNIKRGGKIIRLTQPFVVAGVEIKWRLCYYLRRCWVTKSGNYILNNQHEMSQVAVTSSTLHRFKTHPTPSQLGQALGQVLNLFQWLSGVAEGFGVDVHLVHHAEEKAAHLAVGLAKVVQVSPALDPAAAPTEHHHWQLGRVVVAGQHTGAEHQHRIVERGASALLNTVEPLGDVGHLLEEKLVHL